MNDPKDFLHAPFLHPRRDPHFRKARWIAAAFLSVVQAVWFFSFVIAVQNGTRLTTSVSLIGLAGFFLIASRAGLVAEIALGIVDRLGKLESAPGWVEILRRFMVGVFMPFGVLLVGFAGRDSLAVVAGVLAVLGVFELVYRYGGFARWHKVPIHYETLKELLMGTVEGAANELANAPDLQGRELEISALAVSTLAIREQKPMILQNLETFVERQAARATSEEDRQLAQRVLAVVRADYARMIDPETSAVAEAEALRLIPAGHPRRLALGLFVATSALEQNDPQSAIKALSLLHTRDCVLTSARVLVNWLMMTAADKMENSTVSVRCREALKTFDVEREATNMVVDQLRLRNDPYARWIVKARESLAGTRGQG